MILITYICQVVNAMRNKFIKGLSDFANYLSSLSYHDLPIRHLENIEEFSLHDNMMYSYKGWNLHYKNGLYYAIKDSRRIVPIHKGINELESIIDFEEGLR